MSRRTNHTGRTEEGSERGSNGDRGDAEEESEVRDRKRRGGDGAELWREEISRVLEFDG